MSRPSLLILRGGPALSEFRLSRICADLSQRIPDFDRLVTEFVHFVRLAHEPASDEFLRLQGVLDYDAAALVPVPTGQLLLVTPRPGTISPWSSKATDIAHNCGLNSVQRIERGIAWYVQLRVHRQVTTAEIAEIKPCIHDRMTQSVFFDTKDAEKLFVESSAQPLRHIDLLSGGRAALETANTKMGLALSDVEINYLLQNYQDLGRDPTDVELMMFAQANSEHCRHKIFNAAWMMDGEQQQYSLFEMIKNTHAQHPQGVLSAYRDNAAVVEGYAACRFFPDPENRSYRYVNEDVHILMKVETHNHPTAISPFPGAATGSGGEIRDEGATGRGAKPKAGLTGFSVSHLRIPGFSQAWEGPEERPERIASPLAIMLEGPIGAAAYNNEFGRPNLCGYFRAYEQRIDGPQGAEIRGYHKPIMLAGGLGNVRPPHVAKGQTPPGALVIVLGGPAMLIGLGGGAASSVSSGHSAEDLDFASVQRDNAELQRRCQEVLDRCWALGDATPIVAVHDVGAGGLSNAVPEILNDSDLGGRIDLRAIPNAEPGLSPLEIWCNEAQERYVLTVDKSQFGIFEEICRRERCPYANIGEATAERQLVLIDSVTGEACIDIPMSVLLGKLPRLNKQALRSHGRPAALNLAGIDLCEAARRVLSFPTVASKKFLITIGDRTVSGLVGRDQMVGPWQVPVADCAVTHSGYHYFTGEAMAVGERTPLALIDVAASARMAVGEAISNIAAARILDLSKVVLSANWMAASGHGDEDARLFDAVRTVGVELCPKLGITIPVGKDSLSMETVWQTAGNEHCVTAPMSLIVSAFAPVADVRLSLTPQLRRCPEPTVLMLADLGRGRNRLGGSCLAQVYNQLGEAAPDLDDPNDLIAFFRAIQLLNETGCLLAYHDRSDGGIFTTLCEMAFAGRLGLDIRLDELDKDVLAALFNEELGAVIQVRADDVERVRKTFIDAGFPDAHLLVLGTPVDEQKIYFHHHDTLIYQADLGELERLWSETSYRLQALRDNPECAREEFDSLLDRGDPGLNLALLYTPKENPAAPFIGAGARPLLAVLREQGVNGQVEMAAAFDRAGFQCLDVHMSDILRGKINLNKFKGLAACGGFSYGDVLGAGGGWAKSILFNRQARDEFAAFFARTDTFTLGVCNGCQMLAQLGKIIPGAENWLVFLRNRSEQFEARLVMIEIEDSRSILFTDMAGSRMPIAVAHGEGRAAFADPDGGEKALEQRLVAMRFVDNRGLATEIYPANPNGSPLSIAGLTSMDGRVTILMPHPERVFLAKQFSWLPDDYPHEEGPWLRLFQNARRWVG